MKTMIPVNWAVRRKDIEMKQWEYKVIPIRTRIRHENSNGTNIAVIDEVQGELANLGKQGWELVAIQDTSTQDGRVFTVVYVKRQVIRTKHE